MKYKTMKSTMLQICLSVFLVFFLSSCAGTVEKIYEGNIQSPNEIAFVTTQKGLFICSVDEQIFYATVPIITVCPRNIEVTGPQTYKIQVWNGLTAQTEENTVNIEFKAEPGKLYKVYHHKESSRRLPAKLKEVTDPEEIKLFYDDLANGKIKRELPTNK